MQQYWTPLARVLGLYGETEPAEALGAAGSPPPADGHLATHWPQLFEAFRRHALDEWVPACKRHAEVSTGEKLAVRAITIAARDPVIAGQLSHWKQEGSTTDLVRWLVSGPWNLPEIRHWVDFSGFESLTVSVSPEPPAAPGPTSRFDWRQAPKATGSRESPWVLEAQTTWVARTDVPGPLPANEATREAAKEPAGSDWQLTVNDAKSSRQMVLPWGLSILGQEKTVRMPDGTTQALKDQATVAWEGEPATYVAVQGALVSGLHLAIRIGPDGVQCRDLASTNGAYLGDRRLAPGTWTAWPEHLGLHLGGPASDLRSQAPGLEIARAQAARPVPVEATPLRGSEVTALLMIQPAAGGEALAVTRVPFLIGRDPRCDWVIAPEHAMVSRQHLVIEHIDRETGRIRLRDLSSQGLTRCGECSPASLRAGAWVEEGLTVVLGDSPPYPGVPFSLQRAP